MLTLLPDDHKLSFSLHGVFLKCLPANIRAHLLRDNFRHTISLALKADKIYQSRVSLSLVFVMELVNIFLHSLVLQCLLNLVALIQRSKLLLRLSLLPWRKQELYEGQILPGPLRYTWLRRKMEAGGLAETMRLCMVQLIPSLEKF